MSSGDWFLHTIWGLVTGFYTQWGVLLLVSTRDEGSNCYWFLHTMRGLVTGFYTRWGSFDWFLHTMRDLVTGFYTRWGSCYWFLRTMKGLVTGFYTWWGFLLPVSTHDEGSCDWFLHTMKGLVTGFCTRWGVSFVSGPGDVRAESAGTAERPGQLRRVQPWVQHQWGLPHHRQLQQAPRRPGEWSPGNCLLGWLGSTCLNCLFGWLGSACLVG